MHADTARLRGPFSFSPRAWRGSGYDDGPYPGIRTDDDPQDSR